MSGFYSDRKELRKRQRPTLPETGGLFHKRELQRLIAMLVAALLVGAVTIGAILDHRGGGEAGDAAAVGADPGERTGSVVVLPEIDVARLESLVADATPEQRVILDVAALDWAFETTRLLRAPHYEALDVAPLDSEAVDALLADPPGYRARAFRARGWLQGVRFYEAAGRRPPHFRARLRLEDGGRAWIAVRDVPDAGLTNEVFVRVDGLFVELFRDQIDSGWVEQPLIVGRAAVRSYPALGAVTDLPAGALEGVEDDSADDAAGIPFDAFWTLMAYARDLDPSDVDWDAAPLVTMEVINAIQRDGEAWRGQPVRFGACEVLDCWVLDPGENPARLDRITEGWLGNWKWKGPAVVARFQSPATFGEHLGRRDVATARGFFLKNLAYESRDGSPGIAPFFVVHSAEEAPRAEPSGALRAVTLVMSASLLGLGAVVAILLVRDRRRSRELQADLIRRRRARREQRLREGPATEGS